MYFSYYFIQMMQNLIFDNCLCALITNWSIFNTFFFYQKILKKCKVLLVWYMSFDDHVALSIGIKTDSSGLTDEMLWCWKTNKLDWVHFCWYRWMLWCLCEYNNHLRKLIYSCVSCQHSSRGKLRIHIIPNITCMMNEC